MTQLRSLPTRVHLISDWLPVSTDQGRLVIGRVRLCSDEVGHGGEEPSVRRRVEVEYYCTCLHHFVCVRAQCLSERFLKHQLSLFLLHHAVITVHVLVK